MGGCAWVGNVGHSKLIWPDEPDAWGGGALCIELCCESRGLRGTAAATRLVDRMLQWGVAHISSTGSVWSIGLRVGTL